MKKEQLRLTARFTLSCVLLAVSLVLINGEYENNSKAFADTKEKKVSIASLKVPEPIKIPVKAEKKAVTQKTNNVSPSRGGNIEPTSEIVSLGTFKLTAYDLSVASCGKEPSHKAYGITKTGYDLSEEDLTDRKIAVDPNVIALNSKVSITFPENRRYVYLNGEKIDLNGEYKAVDTGGAIKGNRIDLYVGSQGQNISDLCFDIGIVKVEVHKEEVK